MVACGCVSVLTVSTFIIQPIKVDYPERPILFLSVCYLLLSIGYSIRLIVGNEVYKDIDLKFISRVGFGKVLGFERRIRK